MYFRMTTMLFLILGLFLFISGEVVYAETDARTQADEQKIMNSLQNMKVDEERLYPRLPSGVMLNSKKGMALKQELVKFCGNLLEDLKSRRNVEFVAPEVRTDDFNDSQLQAYLKRCPRLKPYRSYYLPIYREEAEHWTQKEWEENTFPIICETDFRIYPMNIDVPTKIHYEARKQPKTYNHESFHLFFCSGWHGELNDTFWSDEMYLLSFNKCKRIAAVGMGKVYDYEKKKYTGDVGSVIKYRGQYYLVTLESYGTRKKTRRYDLDIRNFNLERCRYYKEESHADTSR